MTTAPESLHFPRQNGTVEDSPQKPECGTTGVHAAYNTGLHVAALFIILILSTLACSFPIIARRFPRFPVPHRFLFLSRHFGTGVLIATAFVHLLPTAFVSLTDPCLPDFWNKDYPPMAGFIAMMSVLVVVGIEMFFAIRGAGHAHGDYGMLEQNGSALPHEPLSATSYTDKAKEFGPGMRHFKQGSIGAAESPTLGRGDAMRMRRFSDARGRAPSFSDLSAPLIQSPLIGRENDGATRDSDEFDETASSPRKEKRAHRSQRQHAHTRGASEDFENEDGSRQSSSHSDDGLANGDMPVEQPSTNSPQAQHEEERLLLQCLLLEAGILFHSVFIGMALSVAVGTSFIVLLVAISFHQTFEGLALGSRIAAVTLFGPRSPKPWLMALAYGATTPIGQAIGLLVHRLYDPQSQTGLLMVGIMNAISSGLLLFAGLVELLAEDFLADKSYETLYGRKRIEACAAVVAGSMLMAIVGAFA